MKEIDIKIKARFGSEFQKEFANKTLRLMLQAWRAHLLNSHKQNQIMVFIDGLNNDLVGEIQFKKDINDINLCKN